MQLEILWGSCDVKDGVEIDYKSKRKRSDCDGCPH